MAENRHLVGDQPTCLHCTPSRFVCQGQANRVVFLFAIFFPLIFLLCIAALFGCDRTEVTLPEGATTIEGTYISDEMPVGYYFSKDGFGQQYIGNEVYQIRYYIFDGKIHIENYSIDGGLVADFPVEVCDGCIIISNIRYSLQENSEASAINTSK